jgi:hypothetical protein
VAGYTVAPTAKTLIEFRGIELILKKIRVDQLVDIFPSYYGIQILIPSLEVPGIFSTIRENKYHPHTFTYF